MSGTLVTVPPHGEQITRVNGNAIVITFHNGYGASIIKERGTGGLVELAVLDMYGDLCYSTHITNDVLRYVSRTELTAVLHEIDAL